MRGLGREGLPTWARAALTELQRSREESMSVPSRSKTSKRGGTLTMVLVYPPRSHLKAPCGEL